MPLTCRQCGFETTAEGGVCGLCGAAAAHAPGPAAAGTAPLPAPASPRTPFGDERRVVRVPVGWVHLGLGLVLALAFTLTPVLRFMGWLLGSLFHETGHVAFAWYAGCPAFPAISLAGHAAAFHQAQSTGVVALVGLVLLVATYLAWKAKRFFGLALALLLAWPLLAFVDDLRELGFLLSGHLGELVFAGIFLWRARTGEAVRREAERPVYACLGWFLVARNAVLCFGIAFVPAARAWYHTSGSFGLTNDYVRVATGVLDVPLAAVAIFMLLVSLAVVPVVLALTWTPKAPAWTPAPVRAQRSPGPARRRDEHVAAGR